MLQLPALVGEIIAGIVVGPNLLEIAPKHESLMLIGELGLILMVLEAGVFKHTSLYCRSDWNALVHQNLPRMKLDPCSSCPTYIPCSKYNHEHSK